jgi:hypothetical protein
MEIDMTFQKHYRKAQSLRELRKRAAELGLTIKCERDDMGWGYWLIGTGWEDETFSTCRSELTNKIEAFAKGARHV